MSEVFTPDQLTRVDRVRHRFDLPPGGVAVMTPQIRVDLTGCPRERMRHLCTPLTIASQGTRVRITVGACWPEPTAARVIADAEPWLNICIEASTDEIAHRWITAVRDAAAEVLL